MDSRFRGNDGFVTISGKATISEESVTMAKPSNLDQYRVTSGFSLSAFDPEDKSQRNGDKASDLAELEKIAIEIRALQDTLHAQGKHKVLVIAQGIDASGKDGTISQLLTGCNPRSSRAVSFKTPSLEELAHDYLWRVHAQTPQAGELVVFNRSHYEDVLIVKVHNWINDAECKRRYAQINDFERMLTETGTTIIKCFLHISKQEQKARMQERLTDPSKTWKFNPNDLEERKFWPEYMQAYEQALAATSTKHAPWYVIPADSKTNRNLMVSRLLLNALKNLNLSYPAIPDNYQNIKIED